jgi:FkbM family methyltransferase
MLNQETELKVLEAVLPGIHPSFVDVGAEKGGFSRWLADHGLHGFAFEPLPQHAGTLQALAADKAVKFLAYAVDAEDGERDFHIAEDADGRPLDYFHSLQPLSGDRRVRHNRVIRVMCRSLGSLVRDGSLPPRVGLVKIDTEGNDLRVLQGLRPLQAQVIVAEYFTAGLYAGWLDADPGKLIGMAAELGYPHCIAVRRSASLEQVSYQPLAFQVEEWGNLIFIDDEVFRMARPLLSALVSSFEHAAAGKIRELQAICDEREALIKRLHSACEALRASGARG